MKNPYLLSLPIILATITGMLATDLYLPAVPTLHEHVGGTAVHAQYTLASFMAAFALGQLIVGSIGDRVEKRKVMFISFAGLALVSLACAWVTDMNLLIAMRALQGFAAAASVALAPAMIRELGDEMTAIKLIGFISSVEAIVPAAAPALGVWLIAALGWQASFYAVALTSIICVVVFWRMPGKPPANTHALGNPVLLYLRLLVNKPFMAFTLGHSFGIGALLTFIFAAPYMLTTLLGHSVSTFAWMQVFLVGSFVIAVNMGPKLVERMGIETTIVAGGLLQLCGGLALFGVVMMTDTPSITSLTLCMIPVNMGLGLRAGPTFTRAMDSAQAPDGSTGALLIFIIALVISAGTSAVAPFLHLGPWTVGVGVAVQTILCMVSLMVGLSSFKPTPGAQSVSMH
jgi:MFS family permease